MTKKRATTKYILFDETKCLSLLTEFRLTYVIYSRNDKRMERGKGLTDGGWIELQAYECFVRYF